MNVQFFCPRWGSENLQWKDFCEKVKSAGYNGIEYAISHTTTDYELEEAFNNAEKNGLSMIPQHYDTTTADFSKHTKAFHAWLERIKPYPKVKVDSQTGKDFFSFEQNRQLVLLGNAYGVLHETHRGKFSFAAHITKNYLEQIPELRLTLDASHWVCVAESFLEDQQEAMQLAIERTEHIHARVGYAEGPQVPDPRVPEWQHALNVHLSWWDKVIARKRFEGANSTLTITPEFGPFPYMVPLPFTQQPITNQWEVNTYMMQLLRERYC